MRSVDGLDFGAPGANDLQQEQRRTRIRQRREYP